MSPHPPPRILTAAGVLTATATLAITSMTTAGAAATTGGTEAPDPSRARLIAHSVLPAATYVPGSERSGAWTTGNAAIPAPYPGQPVQGFSATHRLADGSYLVMSDNGFGAKANSADFLLAVHRIRPNAITLPTAVGAEPARGPGTAYLGTPVRLSDPEGHVAWPIWRDGACDEAASLPSGYSCPTSDRLLTGWDFDIESMQVAKDGTYWFGDEFGPYLLHTDATGRLLQAPIPTPGVRSPSNPQLPAGETANLANSKGFEGMAIAPDLRTLHPMLEGTVAEDRAAGRDRDLRIYTVPTKKGASFDPSWVSYRMDDPANAIGDFALVNDHQGLVIERDNNQGATAVTKRVYLIDLERVDADGVVHKQLLVDLMDLPNPQGLGGFGDPFTFPYVTIEDVEIIDSRTIAVMNDNNFPATGGRSATAPDVNEYLEIRLPRALKVSPSLLPRGRVGDPVKRFDVQAHRGGIGMTTEESLQGFSKALALGVRTLELDTQVTEDEKVVVTHDRQVQATKCRDTAPVTAGDTEYPYVGKYIRDLTLAQVKTLDCGYQQLPGFPAQEVVRGNRLAELSDVFDVVKAHRAHRVTLNIETKVEAGAPEQTAPRAVFVRRVAEQIEQSGLQRQVVVQSFDWGALREMHSQLPRVPLVALTNIDFLQVGRPGASPWLGGLDADDFGGDFVAAADAIPGVEILSPLHGTPQGGRIGQVGYRFYTDAAMVERAHERGLKVVPWTINDPATMEALIDAGVDGLITDYPNALREVLRVKDMALPRPAPPKS